MPVGGSFYRFWYEKSYLQPAFSWPCAVIATVGYAHRVPTLGEGGVGSIPHSKTDSPKRTYLCVSFRRKREVPQSSAARPSATSIDFAHASTSVPGKGSNRDEWDGGSIWGNQRCLQLGTGCQLVCDRMSLERHGNNKSDEACDEERGMEEFILGSLRRVVDNAIIRIR